MGIAERRRLIGEHYFSVQLFQKKNASYIPAYKVFCSVFGGVLVLLAHSQGVCYKGKVKVKFSLEQATKAQRGSRGIAILFL